VTRRRTPTWAVGATAWAACVVLAAGLIVLGAGLLTPPGAAPSRTEALARPAQPAPTATRPPVPTRHTAQAVAVTDGALGPPPGPQYDPPPAHIAAPADRYALVVGGSAYHAPTHPTVAGADDARLVSAQLLQDGWLPQNIRVLTEDQATGSALRPGLDWLAGKGAAGTFSYFHFSGHVKQEGGHEKLWPVDHDFVTDSEVATAMHRVRGHLWMDIAGCEGGGFLGDLPSDRVLVSASSQQTQKSYEYPQWHASVWTGLVFQIGTAQLAADADHDGRVTMGEALRYATYYAQVVTLKQSPYGRQTPQVEGDPVRGWTLAGPPA